MVLHILRGAFILLAATVTSLYVLPFQRETDLKMTQVVLMLGITIGTAATIVAVDMFVRGKRLSALSGVFLGLLGGLLAAYALSFVVDLVGMITSPPDGPSRWAFLNLLEGVKVFIGLVTCYLGISLVMQTKDDFRFVLPYVEFAKEIRGMRPTLMDTSVIIDGRIVDILTSRIIQGPLLVPKFVLLELQSVADSPDRLRRARGRRGLEMLQQLRAIPSSSVSIEDTEAEGATVDQKLLALAERLRARIMTSDYNLGKIAAVRGLEVINLNEVAKALRPVVLPGEPLTVKIVKPGEGPTQGVGYLEDGTMVVVENARQMHGREIELVVTSTLQTSAGRMIFGRISDSSGEGEAPRSAAPDSDQAPGDAPASGQDPRHTPPPASRSSSGHNARNPRRG